MLYFIGPFFLHFMEGATESLFTILQRGHPAMLNVKVLHFVEGRGKRQIPAWRAFYGQGKGAVAQGDEPTVVERIHTV